MRVPPNRFSSRLSILGRLSLVVLLAAAAAPLPAQSAVSGSIAGVVGQKERAPRRTLDRYGGSGSAAPRTLQQVPPVVFIVGAIDGSVAPAARAQVAQKDTAFVPAVLVVPVGSAVAFPNQDPFFHNVISFSPTKRFDLGRYPKGESKSVVFEKAGAAKVYCEVHQFMRAAVLVVENPYYAVVGEDGRFAIAGVPPGRHRLVVWSVDRRQRELEVSVTPGAVTQVNVTLP